VDALKLFNISIMSSSVVP